MRGSWLSTRCAVVDGLGATLAHAQQAEPAHAKEPTASAPAASGETQASSPEGARERARSLGYSGIRAYGAGDYTAAHEQLERAFSLLPVP
ncbi:MAG: hypothetical protein RL033_3631 [Pseudomonadota bacterium]